MRPTLVGLSLVSSLICSGQQMSLPHLVKASGEATLSVKPDRARITLGVDTHAGTAAAAVTQNAAQTAQVLEALKKTVGGGLDLKTSGYSLQPDITYPRDGGTPKTTGYHAQNSITGTLDDLTLVGKFVDAATGAGANNVSSISFDLKNEADVRSQALVQAASQAKANAEAIAKALNLQVVAVVEANVADAPIVRPLMQSRVALAAMPKASVETPIEAGNVDVHARVEVAIEVR
jgi:uncharacterized protein